MQISSSIPLICSVRVKAFMRQGRFFGASPVSGCLLSPSGRWDPRRSPPALSSDSQPAETLLQGHKHTMSGSGCSSQISFFFVCVKQMWLRNLLIVCFNRGSSFHCTMPQCVSWMQKKLKNKVSEGPQDCCRCIMQCSLSSTEGH